MSKFEVKMVAIDQIEPIPNADAIEVASVGGFKSVVKKDQFKPGDLAIYIPEQAVVPQEVLAAMGLVGRLTGPNKDRVKAVKLRGVLSQGLLLNPRVEGYSLLRGLNDHFEGQDCADILGITKYEPPIPTHMAGEVYNAGTFNTVAYDIENVKKYPNVLVDGEEVVMTEKLHGTFTGIGILPRCRADDSHIVSRIVVFSKGLGSKGLCFKPSEANASNVYMRTVAVPAMLDKFLQMYDNALGTQSTEALYVFGETYGKGVQDLSYGVNVPTFRAFDVAIKGANGQVTYFNYDDMVTLCGDVGIECVPVVYRGPYSTQSMNDATSGTTTLFDEHIREGVVIKPTTERYDSELGRVNMKSVSEDYYLRKNVDATEYN